jgi:hypothetical protein
MSPYEREGDIEQQATETLNDCERDCGWADNRATSCRRAEASTLEEANVLPRNYQPRFSRHAELRNRMGGWLVVAYKGRVLGLLQPAQLAPPR